MDWRKDYEAKFISAERVAEMVKSGDRIAFTVGREAFACGLAIAARKEELKDVKIFAGTPTHDFGWYDAGWEDSFSLLIAVPTATCQEAVDERRCDILPTFPHEHMLPDWTPDLLLAEVSPPDGNGFCSFGNSVWNKKKDIRRARKAGKPVVAELNNHLIRTYGDNFIHVSEIDYFVEHQSGGGESPGTGSLAGRAVKETEPYVKEIVRHVRGVIRDGDTVQIGVGRTTEQLVRLGIFEGKNDIGFHSEATPPGVIALVREGIITGARKTLHRGKVVATSIGGSTREEMEWVRMNPLFNLFDYDYVSDYRVIAAHDNMTAINNALLVDLGGQITAESLGPQILGNAGGQPDFAIAAIGAKGGRSLTILPSTGRNGKATRIVPVLPEGTWVTIPRTYADYIITEYGVARLRGKSMRERAAALISIARPDFREELTNAAKRMFG